MIHRHVTPNFCSPASYPRRREVRFSVSTPLLGMDDAQGQNGWTYIGRAMVFGQAGDWVADGCRSCLFSNIQLTNRLCAGRFVLCNMLGNQSELLELNKTYSYVSEHCVT